MLESEKAVDILTYIFCYGLDIKDKPGKSHNIFIYSQVLIVRTNTEQHGLCRAVSYIVQSLSAEQSFGLKLTSPFKVTIPQKWGVVGNAGDFLINVS